jgi:hypothetical protein
MANCHYCTHLTCTPEGETRPTWEPQPWRCTKGWTLAHGEHGCADYVREPGTDDDLMNLDEPWPG